ncbi:hypothetical protein HPT29_027425 (plasmid) [Microvirga terrae]|uniref:NERD domain-containing protein n=1 Tax=Microvirga terrae TaxID=2740529 RepID=A0ABY5RZT4_9HYPH|nr:hypothetical protein [Microvirga terrae]UVF22756.1 hypothetical protein HPT29_027425 [Microvirga terrae]
MTIEPILVAGLKNLATEFHPHELAYLAATCKIEFPIRDKLAFYLHRELAPSGLIVAREWSHIDLAIVLSTGQPAAFLEAKAMYTFDALKNPSHFTSATSADEKKAKALAGPDTAVYSLLLATHLDQPVLAPNLKVVKYSAGINRALQTHQTGDKVRAKAIEAIGQELAHRHVVKTGEISGGTAFGIGVSVLYWLVRNDE